MVKYISIIFAIATLMGSLHHHNDMRTHSDCKVCTVQHNIIDIDTPLSTNYITLFSIISEATLSQLTNLQIATHYSTFSARAPPFYT